MSKLGVIVYTNQKGEFQETQNVLLKQYDCVSMSYVCKVEELFAKLKEHSCEVLLIDNSLFVRKELEKFISVIQSLFMKHIIVIGEEFSSCKTLYTFVANYQNLATVIENMAQQMANQLSSHAKPETCASLSQAVVQDLICMGLQPKHCGFQYLKDCVLIGIMSRGKLKNLTKEIYPLVASKYAVSNQCVERSIRYTIDFSVYNCKHNAQKSKDGMMNFIWDFPTNRNVISFLINKIMIENNMMFAYAE